MHEFAKHVRHAARGLRNNSGFTFFALAILTLGIGANTAIFSVVNAVLLRPLPFPDSDSIVTVFHVPPAAAFPGMKTFSVSVANYLDWQKQNTVFQDMAAIGRRSFRLGGGSRPQAVITTLTEPGFFNVLRVQPAVGRAFRADECQPGKDTVIVLSHGFAQSQFGSASQAVGRRLELNGRSVEVIGVMAPDFHMKSWFPASTEAWAPLAWTDKDRAVRGNHNYLVIARLRDSVSLKAAQSQMDVISDRLARDYPEEDKGWGAVVTSLTDYLVGDVRPALLTLLGAVGFVLLIACANTANLVLARTIGRRKELAIRAALGASTAQVLRPVLIETTLLAVVRGALGLLIAHSGQSLVMGALADQMPRSTEVRVDARVLGFTLLASLLTGVAAGLIAGSRLLCGDLNDSLKQGLGKTDAYSGGQSTRSALVACEVALSLILLVGAGLMIRTLWTLRHVDPGFQPAGVVSMTVPIAQSKEKGATKPESLNNDEPSKAAPRTRFYDEFLGQVRAIPGVVSVGAIDRLPMDGGGSEQPIVIEGRPAEVFALQPNVSVRVATPGYLQTMRIPVVSGRDFTEADTSGERPVVLISQAMARQFWPGENPIGKRLRISFTPDILREVVGLVGDVKERGLDVMRPVSMLYEPLEQTRTGNISLVVRSTGDPSALVPAIARVLQKINPELPLRNVKPLQAFVADSLSQHRFSMFLFAALAGLAFLLAAVGIYSVLSYNVRTRVREIGIRMALGARGGDVLRLIVVEGMKPVVAGVATGAFGAYLLGRVMSGLIFGVSATDPYTFAGVVALLGWVALVACAIPAYRATRVEPVSALRNE